MTTITNPKIIHVHFLIILILKTDCIGAGDANEVSRSTDSPISDSDRNGTVPNWPVPLPSRFHFYDLDGDGALTLKELAKVTGTSRNDARPPFEAADENGETPEYKKFRIFDNSKILKFQETIGSRRKNSTKLRGYSEIYR